ncbi:helix-turn-helix domain-containing protein [Streptomyces sp. GD-15H]
MIETGRPLPEVAEELGVHYGTLHSWVSRWRRRRPGPKARSKWLTGSIHDTAAQVVAAAFDQAEHRDPEHRRCWVVLVDGARHQLDLVTAEAKRRGGKVHIVIDLIHVLEYL